MAGNLRTGDQPPSVEQPAEPRADRIASDRVPTRIRPDAQSTVRPAGSGRRGPWRRLPCAPARAALAAALGALEARSRSAPRCCRWQLSPAPSWSTRPSRVGQVSGVAALDLRFVLLGLFLVGACLITGRFAGAAWPLVTRLACAAVAGLTTGLIAGGILLALRGTDWPLFANGGDSGQLLRWADALVAGRGIPADYPPAVIHLIAWWSELTGDSTPRSLRALQVGGTALFGPVSYLAWRLLLAPGWALAVTLVAALPLLEPYKPYTTVVLAVLVPVLIALLGALRRVDGTSWSRIAAVGLGTGVALGSAVRLLLGVVRLVRPRGAGRRAGPVPLAGGAGARAGAARRGRRRAGRGGRPAPVRAPRRGRQHRRTGSSTSTPTSIRRTSRCGATTCPATSGPWPPPGELAGVGVFVLLLVIGLGLAVALGGAPHRGHHAGLAAGRGLAAAPVVRLPGLRHRAVQLYPRTSAEILYCLLLLSVFAVRYGVGRIGERLPRGVSPVAVTVGGLCAALLLGLSIGSSVADRYQPRNDGSVGLLAYVAQMVRQPDGTCPDYGPDCAADTDELAARNAR